MNNKYFMYQNKINKEKDKEDSFLKRFIFSSLIKTLIVICLFLGSLIYIRSDKKNKSNFKTIVYNNSLSFAKIYNVYSKYLGDAIPFKNSFKDKTRVVSKEKITYTNIVKENNGYMLDVSKDYALSNLSSGIVVEKREDETYKNIIKIQDKNGLNITYGMLTNVEVNLYDYVDKGELLGGADEKLYLIFEKDNKYLSYEKYL